MANSELKNYLRGAYKIQHQRVQMGNRIVANFKTQLGQKPSAKEETLEPDEIEELEVMRLSYRRLADAIVDAKNRKKAFKGDEIISSYTMFCLIESYLEQEAMEKKHFKAIESILQDYPIYTEYLKSIKGCGPALSAVIISEFDIEKAKYSSSMLRYAGMDVSTVDGKGRSKRSEHLIDREYTKIDGTIGTKKSITYNEFLRSKLLGVLAGSFLKCKNERYAGIYYDYKTRYENHVIYSKVSAGHRHRMAIRKMIKVFILDLYENWKKIEGLEVWPHYHVAKLGMLPHGEGQAVKEVSLST